MFINNIKIRIIENYLRYRRSTGKMREKKKNSYMHKNIENFLLCHFEMFLCFHIVR